MGVVPALPSAFCLQPREDPLVERAKRNGRLDAFLFKTWLLMRVPGLWQSHGCYEVGWFWGPQVSCLLCPELVGFKPVGLAGWTVEVNCHGRYEWTGPSVHTGFRAWNGIGCWHTRGKCACTVDSTLHTGTPACSDSNQGRHSTGNLARMG